MFKQLYWFLTGCRKQTRYAEIGAHDKRVPLHTIIRSRFCGESECVRICFSSVMFVDCSVNSSTLCLLCSLLFMKSIVSLQKITETNWYRKYFASSNTLEIMTDHTLEVWTVHCVLDVCCNTEYIKPHLVLPVQTDSKLGEKTAGSIWRTWRR